MKVLITGAFGNLGRNATRKLLEQGHQVRCFDIKNKANEKSAGKISSRVEVVWGDIRRKADVEAAVAGIDVAIHLAFVLPPVTDDHPELAENINVGGTKNVIEAMKKLAPGSRIIFSSSFTVFGNTQHLDPPRVPSDPVEATDNYTQHKIDCEKLCAESGLEWCVMRFAVVPPPGIGGLNPKAFAFPFKTRVEFLHPLDAGLALANAAASKDVWGKVLLIGGGGDSQIYYGDFISRMMEAMGVGRLPEEAFGDDATYTDWLDTSESQRLLNFQQHTFAGYLEEMPKRLGPARYVMPLVRPFARRYVLGRSPYLKANKAAKKAKF
ncbi:MAG: NAD(P)-dependent oxidoreductase [Chloroflexota bacterium]|nr:NAD(P)-dependent oxidoreductase [Chloroflexota bacterium]